MDEPSSAHQKPKSSRPLIAGILLILASVSSFAIWFLILRDTSVILRSYANNSEFSYNTFSASLNLLITIEIIFTFLTLIGGIFAIRRKTWSIAVFGSVVGLFTLGLSISIIPTATVFSLIALTILLISREEFPRKK